MSDSTGVQHCSVCNTELESIYFAFPNGKLACRKCYNTYLLQCRQYVMISDNICHCENPVEISICPNCGKIKYA